MIANVTRYDCKHIVLRLQFNYASFYDTTQNNIKYHITHHAI